MKLLNKTAGPAGKILTAFAQFSAEFFLSQPGCRQMTPGSKRLNKILNATPLSPETRYLAVASDWNKSLISSCGKRIPAVILDSVIKLVLGNKNDWVVNFENQKIVPFHYSEPFKEMKAMHTQILEEKNAIGLPDSSHDIMYDFFRV